MNKDDDGESLLGRFSARPVPPEIRKRVLHRARLKAAGERLFTPSFRLLFIVLLLLGALSVLVDWPLTSRQQKTLEAVLNWAPDIRPSPGEEMDSRFAELLAEFPDLEALPRKWLIWGLGYGEEEGLSRPISLNDIREKIHDY